MKLPDGYGIAADAAPPMERRPNPLAICPDCGAGVATMRDGTTLPAHRSPECPSARLDWMLTGNMYINTGPA